ncbi:MAG TPA: GNAT family N-acetyltransferase [Streptosporangiaceae bacterium]|nr:GNAT family N-acetyltransferase [Streptosporangiaceae bacterium]
MDSQAVSIRPATRADVGPLADVMARAFYDDPPFVWMLPEPRTRHVRARRLFATILRAEALGHGGVEVAVQDRTIIGGTIWLPPGHAQPSTTRQLLSLPGYIHALGRHLGPASQLLAALARAHPREPHWYLYVIGVEPARQGHGVASSLLRSRLRHCDLEGQPAYLESSKVTNVPLYEHFGFRPAGTPALPAGAPVLTAMWRAPTGSDD